MLQLKLFIIKLIKGLRARYKVLILKDGASGKVAFNVSLWVLISCSIAFTLFLFIFFTALLRFTSLKDYLVGGDKSVYRSELLQAYERIDSLDQLAIANELYLSNLQKVISGTVGESIEEAIKRDSEQIDKDNQITSLPQANLDQKYLEDEAVLKSLIELQSPVLTSQGSQSEI